MADQSTVNAVALDIARWFVNGDRPDEFKLKEWAERLDRDAIAKAAEDRAAPLRLVAAAQKAVDEFCGWKLVPLEPTNAMLSAAVTAWANDVAKKSSTIYRAMVEAAPRGPNGVRVDAVQSKSSHTLMDESNAND